MLKLKIVAAGVFLSIGPVFALSSTPASSWSRWLPSRKLTTAAVSPFLRWMPPERLARVGLPADECGGGSGKGGGAGHGSI
jgi:hypothetical protein